MSCAWQCVKWTWRLVRFEAPPRNPYNGHQIRNRCFGKDTRQVWDSMGVGGGDPSWSPRPTPCWLLWCVRIDPDATSTLHTRHSTLLRRWPLLSRHCLGPSSTLWYTTAGYPKPTGSWWHLLRRVGAPPQRNAPPRNRTRQHRRCEHSAPPTPQPCNPWLPCVYSLSNLSFLKNTYIQIRLQNSLQGGLQPPVQNFSDVIHPKADRTYQLLPDFPTSPHITSCTPTHTWLAERVSLSSPPARSPCRDRHPTPSHPDTPLSPYDSCLIVSVHAYQSSVLYSLSQHDYLGIKYHIVLVTQASSIYLLSLCVILKSDSQTMW